MESPGTVNAFVPEVTAQVFPLTTNVNAPVLVTVTELPFAMMSVVRFPKCNRRIPWRVRRYLRHSIRLATASIVWNPSTFSMNSEIGPSADHPQKLGRTMLDPSLSVAGFGRGGVNTCHSSRDIPCTMHLDTLTGDTAWARSDTTGGSPIDTLDPSLTIYTWITTLKADGSRAVLTEAYRMHLPNYGNSLTEYSRTSTYLPYTGAIPPSSWPAAICSE